MSDQVKSVGPVPECVVCVPSELASALHLDHSRVKVCVLASAHRLGRLPSGRRFDRLAAG
jgi:hypothetical protein